MSTLWFWFRPAFLVSLWMVVAAFTLSELATVVPALLSSGGEPPAVRVLRTSALRARSHAVSRRASAP